MKFIKKILPPEKWKLPVSIALGAFLGLFVYLVIVSNAPSYISDEPKTCINCHVMNTQYATWFHSSHREVANCNDCHVPHTSVFAKYLFKAMDGMRHSAIFTLKLEPQVIIIKEAGRNTVQENCKRCHSFTNEEIATMNVTGENSEHGQGKLCWDCHKDVPHGSVRSLSATPNALVPELKSPVPEWLEKLM